MAECGSRRLELVVEVVLEVPGLRQVDREVDLAGRRRKVADQVDNDGRVCAVGAHRGNLGT